MVTNQTDYCILSEICRSTNFSEATYVIDANIPRHYI